MNFIFSIAIVLFALSAQAGSHPTTQEAVNCARNYVQSLLDPANQLKVVSQSVDFSEMPSSKVPASYKVSFDAEQNGGYSGTYKGSVDIVINNNLDPKLSYCQWKNSDGTTAYAALSNFKIVKN